MTENENNVEVAEQKDTDTPEMTVEEYKAELDKRDRLLEFERSEKRDALEETKKWRDEAKDAFNTRDDVKKAMGKEDMLAHYESLKEEVKTKDNIINQINEDKLRDKKVALVKEFTGKANLKKQYEDILEKFVDFDSINLDSPITAEIQIDLLAKQMPDLFNFKNENAKDAWSVPKLNTNGSTIENYSAEYQVEMNKPTDRRDYEKMAKIKEKLSKL